MMENRNNIYRILLFFVLIITAPLLQAERRTRRSGRISQALAPQQLVPQRTVEVKVSSPLQFKEEPASLVVDGEPEPKVERKLEQLQEELKPSEFPAQFHAPELRTDELILPSELQKETMLEAQRVLEGLEPIVKEQEKIELQFEDADLQNFIEQVQDLFNITFIADEAIKPMKDGGKEVKGHKISFKTQEPMTKAEVWNLFVTFLEIAGFAVARTPEPTIYRIQPINNAQKAPLPAFIGVPSETLPETNDIVRFVYFIENSTVEAITKIVESLKSPDAQLIALNQHKAFLLTDKSYNIKTLMNIVKELDRVTMPQALSVIKLRNADALEVKQLYETLSQTGADQVGFRGLGPRRQPTSLYFPENTRVIAEPRTNSLILLGAKEAIRKIEEFIVKYVDVELDQPYSPLHTYQLKYASASVIAEIMNNVVQFGKDTSAGKVGGVRGGDKYLGRLAFIPESQTNRLIIRGDYNDFLVAKDILDKLDEPQPQVAIEILIVGIQLSTRKELGAQIRSKFDGPNKGLLGSNVQFQTSGLRLGANPSGIISNPPAGSGLTPSGPGFERLLGNLLNLLTPQGVAGAGNTVISLGKDLFGVWGVLAILESLTNLQVISNPFVIATNKTPATVAIGETRRVQTGEIITSSGTGNQNTLGDANAALSVTVNPQINSDGMIVLDLTIDITQFIETLASGVQAQSNPSQADTRTQKIKTQTIVADKEVLALGGLIRTFSNNSYSKVPILGDIPIFGWLFRNQLKNQIKDNLLILISTRIISPEKTEDVSKFTQERIRDYHGTLAEMHDIVERRDPIQQLFFAEDKTEMLVEDFIFGRSGAGERSRKRRGRNRGGRAQRAGEKPTTQGAAQPTNPGQPVREPSKIIDLQPMQPPIPGKEQSAEEVILAAKKRLGVVDKKPVPLQNVSTLKRRMPSVSSMLNANEGGAV